MNCHNCNNDFEGRGGSITDSEGRIVFAFCSANCAKIYIRKYKLTGPAEPGTHKEPNHGRQDDNETKNAGE